MKVTRNSRQQEIATVINILFRIWLRLLVSADTKVMINYPNVEYFKT